MHTNVKIRLAEPLSGAHEAGFYVYLTLHKQKKAQWLNSRTSEIETQESEVQLPFPT